MGQEEQTDRLFGDSFGRPDPQYWVDQVRSMPRYTPRDKTRRAPYKPLLLLWMIRRQAEGRAAEVPFADAKRELGPMLNRHRIAESKPNVNNPFFRLVGSSALWTATDSSGNDVGATGLEKVLNNVSLQEKATGRLAPSFARALRDQGVLAAVVNALLEMEWPETQHQRLLEELDLAEHVPVVRRPRDGRFRREVLEAYREQCSFCGFDLQFNGSLVGIEAAHVRWHAKGGPDEIKNGLALCVQHHDLFDRGALGLDPAHRILVNEKLYRNGQESAKPVRGLAGQLIRFPTRLSSLPAPKHIAWHSKEVFEPAARL